jgi:gliding motility-associated-like protein
MTITVNPNVAPVFTQVAPVCNGATLAALLTTSTNNITGTWSPALNNTSTTTYTFTPTAGQCATTATMTITVNPIITPAFTQVAAICSGADLSPLPTISTNGVNGTWSPALNYTATTTYTFTPISRQCATTTTMTITVNPNITPTFTQVAAICAGAPLAPLPTISNNGFTGTWSPAMNTTATTTYTFTPTAGQCATTATMTVIVNPLPLPPTGTITQTFCANIYPTLQNIVVNPTNVNWFSSLTSSTPLPITTNLPVGSTTYYASQFDAVTGCSSNGRLAVLATVLLENTPSTLTDQTFCSTDLKTLADIKTNGLNIVWYSSASGGTPLLGSYVLTSSQSLYAAIYNATTGCESPIRQMVQITIINCQLVANNLLTLNDNSLNDNLKIDNIENFPINQIEIYNRFGELVWKTEYYNNDTNTFKGRANVSGVFQKDSDLPTGTYYFLLKYYDSYRGKYTDLKSFLYINNNN